MPVLAQETTPEPPAPTLEPTLTATPTLFTETPTLFPTDTETPSYSSSATTTPTLSQTPSLTPTSTDLFAPSPTFTAPVTPTISNTELSLFFQDDFLTYQFDRWIFNRGWTATTLIDNPVLFGLDTALPLELRTQHFNLAAQVDVAVLQGSAQLSVRDNGAEHYRVVLSEAGQVDFYRSGVVLHSSVLTGYTASAFYTLQLYAVEGHIWVGVNNQNLFVLDDPNPLPLGGIRISGDITASSRILVDNVALYIPTAEFLLYPQPAAAVSDETPYLDLNSPQAIQLLNTAGTWILFSKVVADEQTDLFALVPCAGTNCNPTQIRITYTPNDNETSPSLSHDGSKLLFSKNGFLAQMALTGPTMFSISPVTDNANQPVAGGGHYSPIDDRILIERFSQTTGIDLYLRETTGQVSSLVVQSGYQYIASWSPDGTHATFTALGDGDIYTVRISDGLLVNLTPETDDAYNTYPTWSSRSNPAVNRIAFTSDRLGPGNFELYTMNPTVQQQAVKQITFNLSGDIWGTVWSPDNNHIAFYNPDFSSGTFRLYIVDNVGAATPTARVITSGSSVPEPHDWTAAFTAPPPPTPTPTATAPSEPTTTPVPGIGISPDIPLPHPPNAVWIAFQSAREETTGDDVFLDAFLGECNASSTRNCVEYSYLVFYEIFSEQKGIPTIQDMLAITYYGELSPFNRGGSTLKDTAHEALARAFFDSQSGACRFSTVSNTFDCTYTNIISWLDTTQLWRDATVMEEADTVRVNHLSLTGVQRELIGDTSITQGYLGFDGDVKNIIFNSTNLQIWRTGQGNDVPSTWGNQVIPAGTTSYTHSTPDENKGHIIIHTWFYNSRILTTYNTDIVYGDNREQPQSEISVPVGTTLTPPDCTIVAIITTTEDRLDSLSSCDNP
ncbi:MAG: hypothetical protein SF029_01280 [bacterium]|nr:hypothetical protein [bacterium]